MWYIMIKQQLKGGIKMEEKITKGDQSEEHRDQLIRDLIYVCTLPYLSKKSKHGFINTLISWSFCECSENNINQNAKYKGCPYWSEQALDHLEKNGSWKDGKSEKGLRHEHIVPRKIFVEAVEQYFEEKRNNKDKDYDGMFIKLKEIMDRCLIGCVVTTDEANKLDNHNKDKMPDPAYKSNSVPTDDWDKFNLIQNPWARYEALDNEIKICKLTWKKKKNHWECDENKEKVTF